MEASGTDECNAKENLTYCERSKEKRRKLKTKHSDDKKKKNKLNVKTKTWSMSECTDEEYDEQKFVEEIKQLPKRNRHAPRRYVSLFYARGKTGTG